MDKVLDARWIAMFMICCTQDGTAYEQLPRDGSNPKYAETFATKMGVAQNIQEKFFAAFGPAFESRLAELNHLQRGEGRIIMPVHPNGDPMTPADLLQKAAELLKYSGLPYTKPACPNELTIQSAVGVLNVAALIGGGQVSDQE